MERWKNMLYEDLSSGLRGWISGKGSSKAFMGKARHSPLAILDMPPAAISGYLDQAPI